MGAHDGASPERAGSNACVADASYAEVGSAEHSKDSLLLSLVAKHLGRQHLAG